MKKVVLVILMLLCLYATYSQSPLKIKLDTVAERITRYHTAITAKVNTDITNERYFSKEAYDVFFDKYFTQINYDRDHFTIGNSAGLSFEDDKTRLNLTLSHKSNNFIFSLGTKVNVTDNSGVIFSSNKPTAGTEASANFSFLIPKWRKLTYKGSAADDNYRKRQELVDSTWLVYSKKNPLLVKQLESKLQEFNIQYRRYDSLFNAAGKTGPYRDSLIDVIDERTKAQNDLKLLDNGLISEDDIEQSIISTTNKASISREIETDGITQFRMAWITGGITYRKDNYATYDSMLVFSKRPGEKEFNRWTLNSTLNFFWQRTDSWIAFRDSKFINSFYGNINYSLIRTNSFDDLDEQTLTTSHIRSQNDSSYTFSDSKKYRDITGKKYETNWLNRIGFVTISMIGKKQFFGLNITGSVDVQNKQSPIFNTHLGGLFRFKSSEDDKSIVNFELFLAFNDMTDTRSSGKSVWQNKQFGISATVPFQKVFFR